MPSWGPKFRVWWEPPPYTDAWWQRALRWLFRKQIERWHAEDEARHAHERAEMLRRLRNG